ncbi:MAG: tetratricopeptide repeat protein [Verrucomicrobiota bacterium]|jgi:hypothetical protein
MKIKYSFRPGRAAKTLLALSFTATLLATAPAARADSPSDLLEQGIYSEQTKGDLDGAMQLYQKVIAQAKSNQALAAQAQYHLGACYYKKQDFTNANAAFESVIKDYPGETNIVALARKYLASATALQPVPWVDDEDMRLDLRLAGGLKVGSADYSVRAGETNGQKTWRFSSRVEAAGSQSVSHVEAEAGTLKPLHSVWKHSLLGEVETVYYPDHADLTTAGKAETKKLEFDGTVLDNEEVVQWMRCLPLADGYKTSQQILTGLGCQMVPLKFEVSGPEQVQVPAGTNDCYKVELNIGQTFWYSSDAKHYLVKFEGGGVIGELTGVTQRAPGEKAAYSDSTFGFSLTAPAGWSFDKEEIDKTNKTGVTILDPQGLAASDLAVQTMSTLKADETNSLRTFANARLAEDAKILKDFKVRSDSWQDRTVAGQPAVGVVSDYMVGKAKKVLYHVWSFGPTNAACFYTHVAASDFDGFRPKFDAVVNSFQTP